MKRIVFTVVFVLFDFVSLLISPIFSISASAAENRGGLGVGRQPIIQLMKDSGITGHWNRAGEGSFMVVDETARAIIAVHGLEKDLRKIDYSAFISDDNLLLLLHFTRIKLIMDQIAPKMSEKAKMNILTEISENIFIPYEFKVGNARMTSKLMVHEKVWIVVFDSGQKPKS